MFHVQAGAFKIRANADELVQKLHASHYPAVIVNRDPYVLVWVGPVVDRTSAERLMKSLHVDGFDTALTAAP